MPAMKTCLVPLLTLVLAAPASAATVAGGETLTITAADGEVNTMAVQGTTTGISITDSTADLTTTATGCTSGGPRTVTCEGTFGDIRADLGDLNDQLTVTGTFLNLELAAGDGNDTLDLTGAAPFARDSRFTLSGNDGDDELRGGEAAEALSGGPGADAMHGGGGLDEADYSDHADDLVVDLTHEGGQGADGEGDLLTDVEDVFGGLGDDVLIGDEQANLLRGNQGRDKLRGGAGDDTLEGDGELIEDPDDAPPLGHDDARGGAGRDRIEVGVGSVARGDRGADSIVGGRSKLSGGPGNDFLGGDRGHTSCGAGRDLVGLGDTTDFLSRDCERVSPFSQDELMVGRVTAGGRVRLTCADDAPAVYCRGRIRAGSARARFRVAPGHSKRVRLRGTVGSGRIRVTLDHIEDFAPIRYDTRI
jgi:Ca2+-binding RTX toxin-like protein